MATKNSYGWAQPQYSAAGTAQSMQSQYQQDQGNMNAYSRQNSGATGGSISGARASGQGLSGTARTLPTGSGGNLGMSTDMGMGTYGSDLGMGTSMGGNNAPPRQREPGDPTSGIVGGGPTGSPQLDQLLKGWMESGSGLQTPGNYDKELTRNIAEDYANFYGIPVGNLLLGQQTQDYNEMSGNRNFGEQQILNRAQMGLDERGMKLEEGAFDFSKITNQRDFEEAVRQFGMGFGLEQEMGRGNLALGNKEADIQRMLGMGQQAVDRYGIDKQAAIAGGAQDVDRYGIATTAKTAEAQQNLERELGLSGINLQRELGLGDQKITSRGQDIEMQLGKMGIDAQKYATDANYRATIAGQAVDRYGVDVQKKLGQGQLDFQGRQLQMDDAYRYQQLEQQAALAREQMNQDAMAARYSAFGRAQAPNMRAAQSWY